MSSFNELPEEMQSLVVKYFPRPEPIYTLKIKFNRITNAYINIKIDLVISLLKNLEIPVELLYHCIHSPYSIFDITSDDLEFDSVKLPVEVIEKIEKIVDDNLESCFNRFRECLSGLEYYHTFPFAL